VLTLLLILGIPLVIIISWVTTARALSSESAQWK
jgi:hypothetical protein